MLKLLYDSRCDDMDAVSDRIMDIAPLPRGMGFVFATYMWGDPEKAKGTSHQGAIHKKDFRIEHLPGLWPYNLVKPLAYDQRQPCEAITLYHDGIDLCADTNHPYGIQHTIIRLLPKENCQAMWKYIGLDTQKAWHKIIRHTLPVHEALPGLMSLARPCQLVPIDPDMKEWR